MTALRMPEPFANLLSGAQYARRELKGVAEWGDAEGMAVAELHGQLIRPLVAIAGWESLSAAPPPKEFWYGAMAVQLAHEASLLHDDVVDGSTHRRGMPTVVAKRGTAAALVLGDHFLTTAYRYAVRTRSAVFIDVFARAVERTVAGELAQAHATGRMLAFSEYSAIARGKAGELLGCALALAPSLCVPSRSPAYYELGCRIGLVYQMLDDLLDLSPATDSGKPALADYAQRHWTWPLQELRVESFGSDTSSLLRDFYAQTPSGSCIRRCLVRYETEVGGVMRVVADELGESVVIDELLNAWQQRAREAVELEEAQ